MQTDTMFKMQKTHKAFPVYWSFLWKQIFLWISNSKLNDYYWVMDGFIALNESWMHKQEKVRDKIRRNLMKNCCPTILIIYQSIIIGFLPIWMLISRISPYFKLKDLYNLSSWTMIKRRRGEKNVDCSRRDCPKQPNWIPLVPHFSRPLCM